MSRYDILSLMKPVRLTEGEEVKQAKAEGKAAVAQAKADAKANIDNAKANEKAKADALNNKVKGIRTKMNTAIQNYNNFYKTANLGKYGKDVQQLSTGMGKKVAITIGVLVCVAFIVLCITGVIPLGKAIKSLPFFKKAANGEPGGAEGLQEAMGEKEPNPPVEQISGAENNPAEASMETTPDANPAEAQQTATTEQPNVQQTASIQNTNASNPNPAPETPVNQSNASNPTQDKASGNNNASQTNTPKTNSPDTNQQASNNGTQQNAAQDTKAQSITSASDKVEKTVQQTSSSTSAEQVNTNPNPASPAGTENNASTGTEAQVQNQNAQPANGSNNKHGANVGANPEEMQEAIALFDDKKNVDGLQKYILSTIMSGGNVNSGNIYEAYKDELSPLGVQNQNNPLYLQTLSQEGKKMLEEKMDSLGFMYINRYAPQTGAGTWIPKNLSGAPLKNVFNSVWSYSQTPNNVHPPKSPRTPDLLNNPSLQTFVNNAKTKKLTDADKQFFVHLGIDDRKYIAGLVSA